MPRVVGTIVLFLFSFLLLACGAKITPEAAKVLVALDEIQRGVESNVTYDQFADLLKTAQAEIDTLKKTNKDNPCFAGAVEKCLAAYEIAKKAWKKKMEEKDEKRKADMEMTLSFSLSFAALENQKANKCYK